jgi:hypothetical protein
MSAAVVTIDAFNHIHNAIMSFIHIFNNDLNELHLEMKEMFSDSESEFESELDLNGLNRLNLDIDIRDNDRRDIDIRDINSFVANFVSGLNIGIISFSHILFGIILSVILSFVFSFGFVSMIYYVTMAISYLFETVWNSLDKGQEWAQLATLMTGFGIYVYIMCYTSYTNNNIDKYIYKLKSEIDEKNGIINELQMKLDNKLKMISNDLAKASESESASESASESEDDTVWETESESDSDSE